MPNSFPHAELNSYILVLILLYRQPGEDSKMLVCDTCDKGYHTFCLKPVMTAIPKNGWKCKVIGSYSDLIVFHLQFNLLLVFCKGLRKQEK